MITARCAFPCALGGRYEIHASYSLRGERRYFVDGRGPTPWKALLSVNQMEQFLRKLAILA